MVAWVRIQRLPIELYNDIFLQRIDNSLGKFWNMRDAICFRCGRVGHKKELCRELMTVLERMLGVQQLGIEAKNSWSRGKGERCCYE